MRKGYRIGRESKAGWVRSRREEKKGGKEKTGRGKEKRGIEDNELYLLLGKMASLTASLRSSARTGASSKAAEAIATLAAAISALWCKHIITCVV